VAAIGVLLGMIGATELRQARRESSC